VCTYSDAMGQKRDAGEAQGDPGPKQHFLPAAFIGGFSDADAGPPRRRPVWVARRGVEQPFQARAERMAVQKDLYTLEDSMQIGLSREEADLLLVDRQWAAAERGLPNALRALVQAEEGWISADVWARTLVPFVAQLFVRGPDFIERFESRFDELRGDPVLDQILTSPDNTNMARLREFQFLLWPVMTADWAVLRNGTDEPFVLNDLGYAAMFHEPTAQYGYAIPLVPEAALVVRRGGDPPGLYWDPDNERWVIAGIARGSLDPNEVTGLNSALAAQSMAEVYAGTRNGALRARREQDRGQPSPTGLGPAFLAESGAAVREHDQDWFRLLTIIAEPPS
jgi:hypothetical protein